MSKRLRENAQWTRASLLAPSWSWLCSTQFNLGAYSPTTGSSHSNLYTSTEITYLEKHHDKKAAEDSTTELIESFKKAHNDHTSTEEQTLRDRMTALESQNEQLIRELDKQKRTTDLLLKQVKLIKMYLHSFIDSDDSGKDFTNVTHSVTIIHEIFLSVLFFCTFVTD
ncbi:hypothetical protein OSTOST_22978, partial [Ostertagia ostertagi]